MRGNEDTAAPNGAAPGDEFTIPMRGNEADDEIQYGRENPAAMFTIPMRGNEYVERGQVRLTPTRLRSP